MSKKEMKEDNTLPGASGSALEWKPKWELRITDMLAIQHADPESFPNGWRRFWLKVLLGWECNRLGGKKQ